MHRSKIEWVDDTWNPITGCKADCPYCYARKKSYRFSGDIRKNMNSPRYERGRELQLLEDPFIGETSNPLIWPFGFAPTYHSYRLDYPKRRMNSCNILVGEMGDMFGGWVPDDVLHEIFDSCQARDIHNYFFLTRFPQRYRELFIKRILPTGTNFWYGSTITRNGDPMPAIPADVNTFLCFEPVLEEIKMPTNDVRLADWIIIGAETGNRKGKVVPDRNWIKKIVDYADRVGIPVFMKNSILDIVSGDIRRDYPAPLTKKELSPRLRARLETECILCGVHRQKKDMIVLMTKSRRKESAKHLCYMCTNCFKKFCNKNGIEVPDLDLLKNEIFEEADNDQCR